MLKIIYQEVAGNENAMLLNQNKDKYGEEYPIDLSMFPNNMGINLCSVKGIKSVRKENGELVSVTVDFIPSCGTTPKERMQIELDELKVRECALGAFIGSKKYNSLPLDIRVRLVRQQMLMQGYEHELSSRMYMMQ